jgi:hypothetical protein
MDKKMKKGAARALFATFDRLFLSLAGAMKRRWFCFAVRFAQ